MHWNIRCSHIVFCFHIWCLFITYGSCLGLLLCCASKTSRKKKTRCVGELALWRCNKVISKTSHHTVVSLFVKERIFSLWIMRASSDWRCVWASVWELSGKAAERTSGWNQSHDEKRGVCDFLHGDVRSLRLGVLAWWVLKINHTSFLNGSYSQFLHDSFLSFLAHQDFKRLRVWGTWVARLHVQLLM